MAEVAMVSALVGKKRPAATSGGGPPMVSAVSSTRTSSQDSAEDDGMTSTDSSESSSPAAEGTGASHSKRARLSPAANSGTDSDDSGFSSARSPSSTSHYHQLQHQPAAPSAGGGLRLLLSGIEHHHRAQSSSPSSSTPATSSEESSPSPPPSSSSSHATSTSIPRLALPPPSSPLSSSSSSSKTSALASEPTVVPHTPATAAPADPAPAPTPPTLSSIPTTLTRPSLPSLSALPVPAPSTRPAAVVFPSIAVPETKPRVAIQQLPPPVVAPILPSGLADAVHTFLTGQLPETLLTIYHASVAQKSYGSEKRFVCPPPMVSVAGRVPPEKPFLRMAIVDEANVRSAEHKGAPDENGRGTFKYLHVTDSSHVHRFHLSLRVAPSADSLQGPIFDSRPVSIISKPSKKTNKARTNALTITSGALVTLFNRVNSQTVRTKYMCVEKQQLCAKNSTWSAFQILLATPPAEDPTGRRPAPVITYGSHVILRCMETNVYSGPLVIKKVVDGAAPLGTTGAVSQMQKVALAFAGQEHLYLSILPTSPDAPTASPFLCYQPLVRNGKQEIDPHLIWTIIGVERTIYRFAELSKPLDHRAAPVALVMDAVLDRTSLEINGRQFSGDTVVFVGSHPVITRVVSSDKIACILPPPLSATDFDRVSAQLGCGRRMYAAILLVRADGIILHSGRFVMSERVGDGTVSMRVVASL